MKHKLKKAVLPVMIRRSSEENVKVLVHGWITHISKVNVFIHRSLTFTDNGESIANAHTWTASHAETGLIIERFATTRAAVIRHAESRINEMPIEDLSRAILLGLAKNTDDPPTLYIPPGIGSKAQPTKENKHG